MYPQRRRRPLGNRINVLSVPRDSGERACRPLRESHHRTWFTMSALLATARPSVSDPCETRRRGERRSSAHRGHQKRRCRCGIMILAPKAIEEGASAYLAKCAQIADPEVAALGQSSPTPSRKAQQAKIPDEKSKGLRARSNPSKRGLTIRGMFTAPGIPLRRFKGGHCDLHWTCGRHARRY